MGQLSKTINCAIIATSLGALASCGEPIRPEIHETPGQTHYKQGSAFIESRGYSLERNQIGRINPITVITPTWASLTNGSSPACTLTAATNDPLPWEDQALSANILSGQRFFRQSSKQLYFFDVTGARPSGLFTTGSCDITASRVTDRALTDDNFATTRTPIASKIFEGTLRSRTVTSLFNGAFEIWTMPMKAASGQCEVAVRFDKQNQNQFDFTNSRSFEGQPTTSHFFLQKDTANGQVVYKFELKKLNTTVPGKLWGTQPSGDCDAKITQYALPSLSLNGLVTENSTQSQTVTAGSVSPSAEALKNNIDIKFNEQTRIEIRERDIPITVQDGTHYSVERTVTSTNEVTFGDTKSTGLDVGSPIISLITGGLLSAEVKQNWENRFSRGVGQSTAITARVDLDPKYCKKWLYSVFATVRDGTIDASGYGEKKPIPFSIVENLEIRAAPQCGPK